MNESSPKTSDRTRWREIGLTDALASLVVFLVALPLCIGIAVACGVPPERGLVTGIIGGILVGFFSGAPLLVSGPAASLIVPVVDLIRTHGPGALAPVVMLAGVWQALAGILRLGQWFRAVAPAVIQGMLIGIGILILASQLHVSLDQAPRGSFLADVAALPSSIWGGTSIAPLLASTTTIALIVGWDRLRPKSLSLVPGQLVALTIVTLGVKLLDADLQFLEISPRFFEGLSPVELVDFRLLLEPDVIGLSLMFAFVASAATLLTANAIDQRQNFSKTNYDQELFAQGVGNVLTGSLGGLPMTGVIVRSSVNVDAGARTRWSTVLHGIWILLFVSAVPDVLELLPRSSLGAILVYTGYRLIDTRGLRDLYRQGRAELAICLVTLFGVVFIDLFIGIMAGLGAAVFKIVYTFARLEIRSVPGTSPDVHDLHLTGSATFLQLPRLAAAMERVPEGRELHVHIDNLDHIDHACLQLLSTWNQRRESGGRPGMVVEWDELTDRYRNALVGTGRDPAPARSMTSIIWAEWKRIYARERAVAPEPPGGDAFIEPSRILLQIEATTLEEVVTAAAEVLAPAAGVPASRLADALRSRIDGHVALGGGISVPHAPLAEVTESVVAVVTTKRAVDVDGEQNADLFFVLLAPAGDPHKHLQSLARVGRICHDQQFLDRIRAATTPAEAMRAFRAATAVMEDSALIVSPRMLAVVAVDSASRADELRSLMAETFGRAHSGSTGQSDLFDMLRRILPRAGDHLVVVPIGEGDLVVLQSILDEERRLVGIAPASVFIVDAKKLG